MYLNKNLRYITNPLGKQLRQKQRLSRFKLLTLHGVGRHENKLVVRGFHARLIQATQLTQIKVRFKTRDLLAKKREAQLVACFLPPPLCGTIRRGA